MIVPRNRNRGVAKFTHQESICSALMPCLVLAVDRTMPPGAMPNLNRVMSGSLGCRSEATPNGCQQHVQSG